MHGPRQILRLRLETLAQHNVERVDAEGAGASALSPTTSFPQNRFRATLLAMASIDEKPIARACREAQQREEAPDVEEEGVVRELQSMTEDR